MQLEVHPDGETDTVESMPPTTQQVTDDEATAPRNRGGFILNEWTNERMGEWRVTHNGLRITNGGLAKRGKVMYNAANENYLQ